MKAVVSKKAKIEKKRHEKSARRIDTGNVAGYSRLLRIGDDDTLREMQNDAIGERMDRQYDKGFERAKNVIEDMLSSVVCKQEQGERPVLCAEGYIRALQDAVAAINDIQRLRGMITD